MQETGGSSSDVKMINKDESDSEEEILLYAEFDDNVNINQYRSVHVLGVNDKNPIIQMDDTFFIGKHESSLGTYMFFEADPSPQCEDPLFDRWPDKCLKYVCKTRKHINMEYAYVTPKDGKDPLPDGANLTEDEIKPVTFTSMQQATDAFSTYFNVEKKSIPDVKE